MYHYHDTAIRDERVRRGTDHCDSDGQVFELSSLVRRRLLYDPRDTNALLHSSAQTSAIIFAVDYTHRFHLGFDGRRGQASAVKHETLFHNANVLAAGELHVSDGIIEDINDHSGSYGTYGKLDSDRGFARAVLRAVDLTGAQLTNPLRRKLERRSRRHG